MRWDDSHESPDLIDKRGEGPAQAGFGLGGVLFLLPWLMRSKLGWLVIAGGVLFFVFRGSLMGGSATDTQGTHGVAVPQSGAQAETPEVHFVSFVLDDVQASWESQFAQRGTYRHAKLVLYTDSTQTGCGFGDAATGPFYCPADEHVYIDLGFFQELAGKLGARGQFAQAYVIAHEIGHHVQKLLGISNRVGAMHKTAGSTGPSVRLELQADCFAGMWARTTEKRQLLEAGDIESATSAAAAVGDDRLQRMAKGAVSPESWTHGSSEERVRWFRRGYDNGSIASCDTFSATQL